MLIPENTKLGWSTDCICDNAPSDQNLQSKPLVFKMRIVQFYIYFNHFLICSLVINMHHMFEVNNHAI